MTDRRFHDGEHFNLSPVEYRVVRGRKSAGDLRLEWRWNAEWQPVPLDHVFLIVDFVADNENVLFPPPAAGGGYVHRFIVKALKYGWRQARHDLQLERARRDERRCS